MYGSHYNLSALFRLALVRVLGSRTLHGRVHVCLDAVFLIVYTVHILKHQARIEPS